MTQRCGTDERDVDAMWQLNYHGRGAAPVHAHRTLSTVPPRM